MSEMVGSRPATGLDRLVISHDGDEYVLGRPDLGIYVAVPQAGAVLVEVLQAGGSPAEATARASQVAGAEVDAQDFLDGLAAVGLWQPPAERDRPDAAGRSGRRGREIRWIEGVSPQAARRLFGPVAWSCYALAGLVVVAVLATRPDLRPSYEHAWWLPDPVLSVLSLLPITLLLAACHEAWHWLAGRAVGVSAIFRVSYRGIFLVFETDLTQIVALPRRRRYGPYLAGIALDGVVLATALGLRLAHRSDLLPLPAWLDRLLAAVVLALLLATVWQVAALFMRSDAYAVLANALRCHDLYRATWLTTKQRLWRLTDAETAELASVSQHDRRVARWFGLLFLVGMVAMGWVAVAFTLPFLISMLWWVGHNLGHPSLTSLPFWESAAVATLVVGRYATVPVLAWRERRLRAAGGLR